MSFFNGWQRKLGCLLMALAIACWILCVRSQFLSDHMRIAVQPQASVILVCTIDKLAACYEWQDFPNGFGSSSLIDWQQGAPNSKRQLPVQYLPRAGRYSWRTVHYGDPTHVMYVQLPPQITAFTLSITSAILIFWKRRRTSIHSKPGFPPARE